MAAVDKAGHSDSAGASQGCHRTSPRLTPTGPVRAGSEIFDDLTALDLKFFIRDRAPAMKFLELV